MPEAPVIGTESTPGVGDNCVNAEIIVPRGTSMEMDCIVSRKCDSDGNLGNANTNPIIGSRHYEVQFDNAEITDLATNVITTSMYAQYDPDGNHVLCLTRLLTIVGRILYHICLGRILL